MPQCTIPQKILIVYLFIGKDHSVTDIGSLSSSLEECAKEPGCTEGYLENFTVALRQQERKVSDLIRHDNHEILCAN
jgi:hypothetical protein